MRKFLITAMSFAALTTSAVAADLRTKAAPRPVVAAAMPFSWTGWYIGGAHRGCMVGRIVQRRGSGGRIR